MPPQTPAWSPAEWRSRLLARDDEAWTIIYTSCKRLCLSILHGWSRAELDPEDVTNQIFKEVLERLDDWDHVESIQAFVHKRARWRCQNAMRAAQQERKRRISNYAPGSDADETLPLVERLPAPPQPTSRHEAPEDGTKAPVHAALQACIAQLQPEHQQILAWRMQDVPFAEIATLLAPPPRRKNTLEVRFKRMIEIYLPRCLRSKGFDEEEIMRIWGTKGLR